MAIYRGTGGSGDATGNVTITEIQNLRSEAAQSATDAEVSNQSALTAQTAAELAETNAETAETNAETAQSLAEAAQTAAELAQTNAETAETNAETAETNAETAQAAAETAQSNAEAAEDNALVSETNALNYSNSASTSAGTATTQAGVATTQASNAATSASTATTQASNASTSASAASSSASSAASSATSAAQSAASAATLLDNFDDRYLGAKASDPSVDNDGDPLVIGALYFNSTDGVMKTYTASGWLAASSASVATMAKFKFTATAGQTVFTGADDGGDTLSMTVGSEIVTLNGIVLEAGTDYTPASGSVTLATGATADDEVNVYAFGNFLVADTVSKSLGGTFTGAVTFENGTNYGNSSSFGQIRKSGGELEVNSYGTGGAAEPITFNQYTTERMRIDASGNVGIGTSSPAAPLQINDASTTSVGSTAGDYTENLRIYGNNGNNGQLSQYTVRDANGTNWTSSGTRLQMKIDTTYMGWMQFNGDGNDGGVSFGAGWSTPTPTGVPERMRIDSAGRVTMPYQPFFEATVSSGWATNSGVLVLPIVTRNIGNHYNSSTGVFTVPVAGVYQFVAKIYSFNSSISTSINKILVNGSFNGIDYGYFSNAVGDTHDKTIVLVCTKYLAAGDNITLSVDAEYYGQHTSFTGHLLG